MECVCYQPEFVGDTSDHRLQIEESIADVDGYRSGWGELVDVKAHRVRRKEMYWNGVGAECVEHDQVEVAS